MSENEVQPLAIVVEKYLQLHRKTSLRSQLLGVDPTDTPNWILARKGRWINRNTLVDLYALAWPLVDCLLLGIVTCSVAFSEWWAVSISLCVAYRLNELFGSVFWVLIHRARQDKADGRKMAMSLLAYLEPILLFAVLHGASARILARWLSPIVGNGYSLGERSWNWVTALHYSVGCYTTVGWGDVSATHDATMFLSDLETATGVIMLAFTISRLVAAALDAGMLAGPEKP